MLSDFSSSDVEADRSSVAGADSMTSPPSSPPPVANGASDDDAPKPGTDGATTTTATATTLPAVSPEEQALLEAEELRAEKANALEEARRLAAARRRQKKKAESRAEREAKARELDELLRQSAAFSDILTKKTEVLGRVGTALGAPEEKEKALGAHDLQMAAQPRCLVGGTMRDYQLEGLTWMLEICLQNMSGILADEMGLGKTVQTISLIALLREQEGYLGPHLIVAPLSTLANWINEFQHWTPSIPVLMYHGTPQQRKALFRDSIQANLAKGRPTDQFPVVCTSYEIILRDRADLAKVNWEFIIIDEGHRMKNFDSKLFRELQAFRSATRFLITGTPLQNNLKELWSLLNFLMPKIFTDWEAFSSWFDFSELQDEAGTAGFIEDRVKQDLVKKIHRVLQPLLLRRVKADVASYLPKKREYILFAPMTREQTDLYNTINDKTADTRAYLEGKVVEHLTKAAMAKETAATTTDKAATTKTAKAAVKATIKEEATETTAAARGRSSRNRSSQVKTEEAVTATVAIRSSPRTQKKTTDGPPAPPVSAKKNAFALMMMGKGRTGTAAKPASEKAKPVSASTSASSSRNSSAAGAKRRRAPAVVDDEPTSKSAKSSRQSTPASSVATGGSLSSKKGGSEGSSRNAEAERTRARARSGRRRQAYRDADATDEDDMSDDEFEAALRAEYEARSSSSSSGAVGADSNGDGEAADSPEARARDVARRELAQKKLGNPLMQLRLVCNSPHNFYNPWSAAATAAALDKERGDKDGKADESGDDLPDVDETLVTASGKMLLLDRLLPALFARGHKVLIFSQFKTQLDLLEAYCSTLRGWPVCRIDGSVAHVARQAQIDLFNGKEAAEDGAPQPQVFLLSTRAGGQGINLASADTVILFDSDWNPQQDLQAQDRAHRIGQTRPVIVYRLATKGTVEEDLLLSADAKRRLEKLVIQKGGFRTMGQKMQKEQKQQQQQQQQPRPSDAADAEDNGDDLDQETLRSLLLKDGQVYTVSGDHRAVLSDHDLDVLCDRSDEAYAKAASGQGDANLFRVIETGVDGITESFKAAP